MEVTTMGLQGLVNHKKVAYFEYDFAKEGGAVAAITLRGQPLPADAVVTDAMIRVNTALTSGGSAQVALSLLAANDVFSAAVISGFTKDALIDGVPDGTITHALLCSAAAGTYLVLTPSVAALTAGKFTVALEYYMMD
jgi:hypothetical protein